MEKTVKPSIANGRVIQENSRAKEFYQIAIIGQERRTAPAYMSGLFFFGCI
jgi:hypothetical protein